MAKKLPEPGFYRSNDKDVIVLDPATIGDGELLTKDGDDARWSQAVAFRLAYQPSPTYVLSADVFDNRFKPTTQEEALARCQAAEMLRDKKAADEENAERAAEEAADDPYNDAEAEGSDGAASAEGASAEGNAL